MRNYKKILEDLPPGTKLSDIHKHVPTLLSEEEEVALMYGLFDSLKVAGATVSDLNRLRQPLAMQEVLRALHQSAVAIS